jgi:hypothetical protein
MTNESKSNNLSEEKSRDIEDEMRLGHLLRADFLRPSIAF